MVIGSGWSPGRELIASAVQARGKEYELLRRLGSSEAGHPIVHSPAKS